MRNTHMVIAACAVVAAGLWGGRVVAQKAASTGHEPYAPILKNYYFHEGFQAGSLRSRVPLPLYDADPGHLWNRLFAVLYVRPMPAGRGSAFGGGAPGPDVEESVPVGLSDELRTIWRETYQTGSETRIEGGDVLEPPLTPQPDSLLREPNFTLVDGVLDEFLASNGERLVEAPLKRVFLQRDLWPVFDLLQRSSYLDSSAGSRRKNYSPDEKRHQEILGVKLAAVMRRLALSSEQIASLPDTYAATVSSGRFKAEHGFNSERDYLPPGLFKPDGDWVEIKTRQNGMLSHTGGLGFEGRAWFRVFCRFPREAGGRAALVRFIDRERGDGRRSEAAREPLIRAGRAPRHGGGIRSGDARDRRGR